MKKMKKIFVTAAVMGILGTTGSVFAANIVSPAEIATQLTGKSSQELLEERAEGKTYGTMAAEAGKLEEFKDLMLKQKKAILDERVQEGLLTQEEADALYKTMEENQSLCDGTGSPALRGQCGAGLGLGQGRGFGAGRGMGNGRGFGYGRNR